MNHYHLLLLLPPEDIGAAFGGVAIIGGPFCIVASQYHVPGTVGAQYHSPGTVANQHHVPGSVSGQTC